MLCLIHLKYIFPENNQTCCSSTGFKGALCRFCGRKERSSFADYLFNPEPTKPTLFFFMIE